MILLGYVGAFGMGLTLGLIGGGGSILAVPLLVYLFGLTGSQATLSSLFVVGTCSAIGVIPFARRHLVSVKTGLLFFAPSVLGVLISRRFLLPLFPDTLRVGAISLKKDLFILFLFGVVMLAAARSMLRKKALSSTPPAGSVSPLRIGITGVSVGMTTGFVGAGGGFLIVPALVNQLALPIRQAVGTSLLIIALNSLSGFIGDWIGGSSILWSVVLPFTAVAVVGIAGGTRLNPLIPPEKLRGAFGWFVLILGAGMILKQFMSLQ